jgi:Tfp pilus assembly protein PilV
MKAGFTLIEVLVSLLVMEVAALGVLGTLVLASETMRRAETLERAVARTEGVLDSLRGGVEAASGTRAFAGGEVRWTVDDRGLVVLTAVNERDGTLLEVRSRVWPE